MLRMKTNFYKLFMRLNKIKYGKGLNLIGIPVIFKTKNSDMNIGNSCTIKSDFLSNLIGLYQRTIIVARDGGKITIGNSVGISGITIYALNSISIGDDTNIGANVKIIDNDFHPLDAEARKRNDRTKIMSKPIIIGKNVFIGCNSIILKGTEIGDNCIIGAGSVVCGKFQKNTIIAGNPAKVIKNI